MRVWVIMLAAFFVLACFASFLFLIKNPVTEPVSQSSTQETVTNADGISTTTRQRRDAVFLQNWKSPSGDTVSEFQKDLITTYQSGYVSTSTELLLNLTRPDKSTQTIEDFVPGRSPVGAMSIVSGNFSPKGTYFTASWIAWESGTWVTYNLKTGKPLEGINGLIPYWNNDESKLAVIRQAASIDGTIASLWYSAQGTPDQKALVKEFLSIDPQNVSETPIIENAKVDGNIFSFDANQQTTYTDTGPHGLIESYTLDLESGLLTNKGLKKY